MYPNLSWKRLFKKFNFFGAYKHFIMITVLGADGELHNRWLGYAESKIRRFIYKNLESLTKESDPFFLEFRPWSKTYKIESTLTCTNGLQYQETDSYFVGIRVKRNDKRQQVSIDLSQAIKDYYEFFMREVSDKTTYYEDITTKRVDFQIKYLKRDDLPIEI